MTYQNETPRPPVTDIPYRPPESGVALETFTLAELVARRSRSELTSHQRLHFELLLVCQSGSGFHEVDFQKVKLTPDRVVHVRPGQVHKFGLTNLTSAEDSSNDFRARLVLLRPLHDRRNWKPGPNVISLDAQTRSDLDAILRLADAEGRETPLSVENAEALRTLIVNVLGLRLPTTDRPSVAEKIFADFEELLGGTDLPPRTVAECARALGCSTRTLGRACRTFASATPKEMIDRAVALEGQRLLGLGQLSTIDIAHALGFTELSHFSRFLSRVVGKGPSQLRG